MRAILWAVLITIPAVASAAEEMWNVHGQSTYIWQAKPTFPSAYEGANSLGAERAKSYSFTATPSLGVRLGTDTELYFEPEVAQGVAFSNLTGLAGFSNGELAKTSGPNPTFYVARLFARQTFELGGERIETPSSAHQLATTYDRRRVVVTAGMMSLLDVFDGNPVAHDPRTQFMNWAFMTHAAYDYAANARGYTYGAAAELFQDDWSFRAGRFAQPREPNGLQLDGKLMRHYGDQIEVVHEHEVQGLRGSIGALAFRTRAIMAAYDDALALATPGVAPTLDRARTRERLKTGFGVDVAQQLPGDLTIFARWMRADGKTETYAFTEADRAASLGLAVDGKRRGREEDSMGFAVARNEVSTSHRRFLERGGQTFFLGDGRLAYKAEHDVEAYYSLALGHGMHLTADYQRVMNPGYNADRGPASFYGIRFHWEG